MFQLSPEAQKAAEYVIGISLDRLKNMTPEEERIFVEKKIGHKLSFNIDKRHIGRGNPLLATGRIVTDDEIERQAQKIR